MPGRRKNPSPCPAYCWIPPRGGEDGAFAHFRLGLVPDLCVRVQSGRIGLQENHHDLPRLGVQKRPSFVDEFQQGADRVGAPLTEGRLVIQWVDLLKYIYSLTHEETTMSREQSPVNGDHAPIKQLMQLWRSWLDHNVYDLARQLRWSYLPPLMIYFAAGVSGVTAIVSTFFVKDYLGLSAEFLATLSFWVMLPWTLKMPLGHLVDLLWRYKSALVYLGAALIAASLLIMANLLADLDYMAQLMPAERWFILATLLAPIGYVMQDIVADAMTVEAVARFDGHEQPLPQQQILLAHTTMQSLGRVAIISGTLIDALANVYLFNGVETMDAAAKADVYLSIYHWALWIPVISVDSYANS